MCSKMPQFVIAPCSLETVTAFYVIDKPFQKSLALAISIPGSFQTN